MIQTLSKLSNINKMSSVNHKITYFLFITTVLTSAISIYLLRREHSELGWVDALLAGSLAHPFFALIVYKTVLLRRCTNGEKVIGIERHLALVVAIGMIIVASSAIRESPWSTLAEPNI